MNWENLTFLLFTNLLIGSEQVNMYIIIVTI